MVDGHRLGEAMVSTVVFARHVGGQRPAGKESQLISRVTSSEDKTVNGLLNRMLVSGIYLAHKFEWHASLFPKG